MRMIFALLASFVFSSVATAEDKGSSSTASKCGALRATKMLPFELLIDAPADGEIESVSHAKYQSSRLITNDFKWDVRIMVPKKHELDFAKAKKDVIADAKTGGSKLTWQKAEKTADGYRLLYSSEEKDGSVVYLQTYVRTIKGKKWRCIGVTEHADAHDCLARACESLRGPAD